jgi:hypothetical protein
MMSTRGTQFSTNFQIRSTSYVLIITIHVRLLIRSPSTTQMFQSPAVIAMSIGATRMYRSITDFGSSDMYGISPLLSHLHRGEWFILAHKTFLKVVSRQISLGSPLDPSRSTVWAWRCTRPRSSIRHHMQVNTVRTSVRTDIYRTNRVDLTSATMLRPAGKNEEHGINASQYQYRLLVAIYLLLTCSVSQRVAGGFQIYDG